MDKEDFWVMNQDICPSDDTIIVKYQCSGCPHYKGFELVNAMPCVRCTFYAHVENQPNSK